LYPGFLRGGGGRGASLYSIKAGDWGVQPLLLLYESIRGGGKSFDRKSALGVFPNGKEHALLYFKKGSEEKKESFAYSERIFLDQGTLFSEDYFGM